jgi:hypothetical protein
VRLKKTSCLQLAQLVLRAVESRTFKRGRSAPVVVPVEVFFFARCFLYQDLSIAMPRYLVKKRFLLRIKAVRQVEELFNAGSFQLWSSRWLLSQVVEESDTDMFINFLI